MTELVVLPQPVQNLLFLHGGGGQLLLQLGGRPLQVQKVLVHLLAGPVLGGTLGLQGDLLLTQLRQPLAQGDALLSQGGGLLPQTLDLGLGIPDGLVALLHHGLLLGPAAGQVLRQAPQLRRPAGGSLPLGA